MILTVASDNGLTSEVWRLSKLRARAPQSAKIWLHRLKPCLSHSNLLAFGQLIRFSDYLVAIAVSSLGLALDNL